MRAPALPNLRRYLIAGMVVTVPVVVTFYVLTQVYQFLGGRFVSGSEHAVQVVHDPEPEDRVERWQWFCSQVRQGRKDADALWPNLVDPPQ